MTTLALDIAQQSLLERAEAEEARPRVAESEARPGTTAPASATTSGATLDDLIAGAWTSLTIARTASCPVCAADLTPRYGSGPHAVGGACGSCGAELS